jgi:hypothetical protein
MATSSKTVTYSMSLDTASIAQWLVETKERLEDAAWKAASAGAKVLYDEVKRNVEAIPQKTGNLKRSIYYVYSKELSNKRRKVYEVSWNHKKAPHGRLVEWGYLQKLQPIFVDKVGGLRNLRRPEFRKEAPGGKRTRGAAAEARFVLRKTPIRTKAWRFIGRARVKFPEAQQVMVRTFNDTMNSNGGGSASLSGGAAP